MHRSLAGMSKKMREVEEENRFVAYKRMQDKFWSERRVLMTRVKAMRSAGTLKSTDPLPIKGINLRAFEVIEDTAALVGGTLLNLAARAVSAQSSLPPTHRRGVTMVVDKAHTPRLKELVKMVQANPKWKEFL